MTRTRAITCHDANVRKSFRLTSQIAMLVAAYDRLRKGKTVVAPDPSLSHAANFLWMLNGEKPSETATKTFDLALILHADHELNASTFAARVIAATLSDIHSAITGAIGALKGRCMAGRNEAVMRMLFAIDKKARIRSSTWASYWHRKRRFRGLDIGSTTRKIRGRPTCGRCQNSWASRPAMRSGSICRGRLRSTSSQRRS